MLPSIWARKLFCFVPPALGITLLLALWLLLPHPAESSNYTVCPSGCDYPTIQSAVTNVAEGSTILVAAGLYQENVIITKSLSLYGVGPFSTTVSGRNLSTVFTIGSGAVVNISGIDIHNGAGTMTNQVRYAGGIYNQGTLTLTNVIVQDNQLWDIHARGGGIYNESEARLTLVETVITDNSANTTWVAGPGYGGGIYNLGFLMILSSTLQDNVVDNFGGGLMEAYGGAIYNGCSEITCGTIIISSSLLANNAARGAEGDIGPTTLPGGDGFGGAIYNACSNADCGRVTIVNNDYCQSGHWWRWRHLAFSRPRISPDLRRWWQRLWWWSI